VLTNGEAALADRSESDSNTSGKETRFSGSNGDGHRTGGYGDLSSQELTSGSRMTTGNESGSGTTGSSSNNGAATRHLTRVDARTVMHRDPHSHASRPHPLHTHTHTHGGLGMHPADHREGRAFFLDDDDLCDIQHSRSYTPSPPPTLTATSKQLPYTRRSFPSLHDATTATAPHAGHDSCCVGRHPSSGRLAGRGQAEGSSGRLSMLSGGGSSGSISGSERSSSGATGNGTSSQSLGGLGLADDAQTDDSELRIQQQRRDERARSMVEPLVVILLPMVFLLPPLFLFVKALYVLLPIVLFVSLALWASDHKRTIQALFLFTQFQRAE